MRNKTFEKLRFIVTAGPTREYFDPVRYISNRSSGKMGYAIAEAARRRGHSVILVSGPVALKPPTGVITKSIVSANDLFSSLKSNMKKCDVLVMAAAVCDFKPAFQSKRKIKKNTVNIPIRIIPTIDVLRKIEKYKKRRFFVGFAAETNDVLPNAYKKLMQKGLDMIVANDVSSPLSGFESNDNTVSIMFSGQKRATNWPLMSKKSVARMLVLEIEKKIHAGR